jgi:hypothetical protein
MKVILLILLTSIFLPQLFAQVVYKDYCNARFGFCVSYPNSFKAQGESDNGDGQEFKSLDGKVSLIVFHDGRENFYESISECKTESYRADAASDESKRVTYKKMGEDYFVISGYQGTNIFYQKSIFTEVGMMTAILKYPVSQRTTYDPYCSKLFDSFK